MRKASKGVLKFQIFALYNGGRGLILKESPFKRNMRKYNKYILELNNTDKG
jgi:hypothetical protein